MVNITTENPPDHVQNMSLSQKLFFFLDTFTVLRNKEVGM